MSTQRMIALEVKLDGRRVQSKTICAQVNTRHLVISTTLPEPELAFELTSAFTGHKGAPTHVAHLTLRPPGLHPHHGDGRSRAQQPQPGRQGEGRSTVTPAAYAGS
jgi:hypothetical protein